MKRALVFASMLTLLSALAGCTFLKVYLKEELQPFEERTLSGAGKDKILLVDISGMITGQDRGPALGDKKEPGLLARVREELDRARMDRQIKALILRINSPGGGVTASDTLYHELKKFKQETGSKVVAHVMDMGTSGAYYAALAADRITAQPTSVTGSIGVIMFRIDATGLMQKVGIQAFEIASGERKGMGSPFRPLSPEERKIFQGVIDSLYGRFITLLSEERKMPLDAVKRLADGRIYTSQEARAAGLIDGIGYLDDAVEQAKKLANLERAKVVTYARPGEYKANLYSMNLINIDLGVTAEPGARFMYLWWP